MPDELQPTPPEGQILIYREEDADVQVRLDGRTVWLTQRLMAELYQISVKTVNEHLVNIYNEGELAPQATIRKFRIVQLEGTREVSRLVDHYNLEAILAVGYRVRSARGTAFRKWATTRLSELLVKGFTMDDERIIEGQTLGDDYFDELLQRIRAIRASERLFYQKITDIYATSIDYDTQANETQGIFYSLLTKLACGWEVRCRMGSSVLSGDANDVRTMLLGRAPHAASGRAMNQPDYGGHASRIGGYRWSRIICLRPARHP